MALLLCALVYYESRVQPSSGLEVTLGVGTVLPAFALCRGLPAWSMGVAAVSGYLLLFGETGRFPLWMGLLMVSVAFLAGRRMDRVRPAVITLGVALVAGLPVSLLVSEQGVADSVAGWFSLPVAYLFLLLVPWQLGRFSWLRERLVRRGWERAEELETEQDAAAERARMRERARIAGDMHDSLGHELSLIALRAAGMEVAPDLGERHRAAAAELRLSAATATERLREVIGVLREDTGSPTEPGAGSVRELVARTRKSGAPVEFMEETPETELPPMVAMAVYRVVRESLTNATKHAPGAPVTVCLDGAQGETVVTVLNGMPQRSVPARDVTSGGHGLAGLRERARLLGGTLSAGPVEGGFQVRAWLPHGATPVSAAPATEAELSESARARAAHVRTMRRALFQALLAPVAVAVVLVAHATVYYGLRWMESELPAKTFQRLTVGQPRTEIAPDLPSSESVEIPDDEPRSPPGSNCEYYRTDRPFLAFSDEAYRLCFTGGVLAAKELLPEESLEE